MHPKYRLFYLTVPNMIGLVRGNEINLISPGQTTLDGKCNKAAALSEANRENPVFITLTCFSYDVTNFSGTCASGNSLAKAKLNNVPTNVRLYDLYQIVYQRQIYEAEIAKMLGHGEGDHEWKMFGMLNCC